MIMIHTFKIRSDVALMKLQNPHNKFFRESVETAKDFITHYFPEHIRQVLDLNTLDIQPGTFIDEELDEHGSDLLFKVNICNEEGYVYLLFEHKSCVAQHVAYQLLKYMMKIWDLIRKDKSKPSKELPVILPLVFYHGKRDWSVPFTFAELLQGYKQLPDAIKSYIPNFKYVSL